jgi:hypothetical protein
MEERAEEYGEAMSQVREKQNGVKRTSELVLYYPVYPQIYSQPIYSCSVSQEKMCRGVSCRR